MTWNLNYQTKQKYGEICGKDLNFPSNDGFDELSDSSADHKHLIEALLTFLKQWQSPAYFVSFSLKEFQAMNHKIQANFSGDFIFEPYDKYSKIDNSSRGN